MIPSKEVKLSENFTLHETRCRGVEEGKKCSCHGSMLYSPILVRVLQAYRDHTGIPFNITSWQRCDLYNMAVGGHPRSFHRLGMAADGYNSLILQGRDELLGQAQVISGIMDRLVGENLGNILAYVANNFIHVDVGHRIGHEGRVRVKGVS